METKKKLRLVIVDVDGVLCHNKQYNEFGSVTGKDFKDIDFTAIKQFRAIGINVVFLSGDLFNWGTANKRKIEFFNGRLKDGKIDKLSVAKEICKEKFLILSEEVLYVGDDLFDIPLLKAVKYAYAPIDANPLLNVVPDLQIVARRGGEGVLAGIFDHLLDEGVIDVDSETLIQKVIELDAEEYNT